MFIDGYNFSVFKLFYLAFSRIRVVSIVVFFVVQRRTLRWREDLDMCGGSRGWNVIDSRVSFVRIFGYIVKIRKGCQNQIVAAFYFNFLVQVQGGDVLCQRISIGLILIVRGIRYSVVIVVFSVRVFEVTYLFFEFKTFFFIDLFLMF